MNDSLITRIRRRERNLNWERLPTWLQSPTPRVWDSNNYLVLDFEVSNSRDSSGDFTARSKNDIILSGRYSPSKGYVQCWGNSYNQQELVAAVAAADFLVCHNAKFELGWLARCGVPLEAVLAWCTQIGEFVRLGNRRKRLSLDHVAKRYGLGGKSNFISSLMEGGICPSEMPRSLLEKYCKRDVLLTHGIFLLQREGLAKSHQLGQMLTRCILTPVLAEIELTGMAVSGSSGVIAQSVGKQLSHLLIELDKLTGGINPNSPIQVAEYLYDTLGFEELKDYRGNEIRTPKGGRKTGADVIRQLKATTPEQKEFKELITEVIKLEDEYDFHKKISDCKEEDNGIIYANLNQTVTQTHRLSSTGTKHKIQYQNIARDRKKYFGPRGHRPQHLGGVQDSRTKGWLMFEGDFPQLEFRVAAHMGRCEKALEFIRQGEDIHAVTASVIFNDPKRRQDAKQYTFGPLYGKQSGPPHVRKWIKAFRDKFPGIAEVQTGWTYKVAREKKLQIETETTFYWPDCEISKSGYVKYTTNIYNYPVQSMATADITAISAAYMWHIAKRLNLKGFMVNTVHDSLIWEIPEEEVGTFQELCCLSMGKLVYFYLKEVYGIEFRANLGVGMKAGPAWSEGEEIKLDVTPDNEIIRR